LEAPVRSGGAVQNVWMLVLIKFTYKVPAASVN
jgi:hypothetical protein